jgi:hypothetical protein
VSRESNTPSVQEAFANDCLRIPSSDLRGTL